jgi:hypothetical protein
MFSGKKFVICFTCGVVMAAEGFVAHRDCAPPNACMPVKFDEPGSHPKPGNPLGYGYQQIAATTSSTAQVTVGLPTTRWTSS